ncbi:kinase suppressor of Ras 1 isoform X1 [Tachysurus ichikawai]
MPSDGGGEAALRQCELLQNMIDISLSSLQGLRTKCAASNDLTQHEIRTLEVMTHGVVDAVHLIYTCLKPDTSISCMKSFTCIRVPSFFFGAHTLRLWRILSLVRAIERERRTARPDGAGRKGARAPDVEK